MPSTSDLAARLAAVLAAQQEILYAVTSPEKIMQIVVDKTPEITGGTGAVIEMIEGDSLIYRAVSGTASAHLGKRFPIEGSLSESTIREKRMVRCDDTDLDLRIDAAACKAIGIRSMIIAPISDDGTAIGALEALSSNARAFDDLDSYTLQLLAGMTSAALMQAHQFREREASEQRYRMLFERNVAGVFRTTGEGRILDCNDALVKYLGYDSKEELLGREAWDLYHDRSDRERLLEQLKRDQTLTNFRLNLKKKNGAPMTGLVNITRIPAEEGEVHLLGTMVEEVNDKG